MDILGPMLQLLQPLQRLAVRFLAYRSVPVVVHMLAGRPSVAGWRGHDFVQLAEVARRVLATLVCAGSEEVAEMGM